MTLEQLDREFYAACHEVSCLNVPTSEVVRMLRNLNIARMQAASRCVESAKRTESYVSVSDEAVRCTERVPA